MKTQGQTNWLFVIRYNFLKLCFLSAGRGWKAFTLCVCLETICGFHSPFIKLLCYFGWDRYNSPKYQMIIVQSCFCLESSVLQGEASKACVGPCDHGNVFLLNYQTRFGLTIMCFTNILRSSLVWPWKCRCFVHIQGFAVWLFLSGTV